MSETYEISLFPPNFNQCFLYYKELKLFLKKMLSLAKLTVSSPSQKNLYIIN